MKNIFKVLKLFLESFVFAFNSVIVNKLRTLLSLLGITIGIFAIITVFTVIDSLEDNIRTSLAEAGENVIFIQKWPWAPEPGKEYEWWQYLNRPVPSLRDFEAIRNQSQKSDAVCFFATSFRLVEHKNNSINSAPIFGTTDEFEAARETEIVNGRFFSPFEFAGNKNLAVIGYSIADRLFENQNPIGKQFKIGGHKATVIGVVGMEGKSLFGSIDEVIVVPMNFMRKITDIRRESANPEIWVRARPGVSNEELKDELRMILRSNRRLKPRTEDNFAMNQISMISEGLNQVFMVLNLAGFFIGIFSILVGGFGIANIMFVSVKERTNQIGIQKALGAKRYFILWQFLFESILLTLTGGIIGLLLVFAGAAFLTNAIQVFKVSLTAGNIMLGLGISISIGIISGFVPARTAARMDPVEAINTIF
jgi:putative ABC transport system permease protein